MFFTAGQLIAHTIGDYVIQTDYMASEKTKKSSVAAFHAITYTIPFLFLTQSIPALLFIAGTHFLMDRFRVARYVCYAKNFLQPKRLLGYYYKCRNKECIKAPIFFEKEPDSLICKCKGIDWDIYEYKARNYPWSECSTTGHYKGRPNWMAVWLLIITDNILHIICNVIAINFM